ncbi:MULTISPECIES: hypothetical protein [Pantoea]|jgi:hypothetical protein|uniref:Arc family DNA-binding protein n=2 Tax=Pantoea dispersa TaxID=59814 RepID=A0ABY2ZT59_9GAMM|nr:MULTISPECIES: hypothetical protein [Pantoea]KAA6094166.1 hypothetical protein F3I21_22135 [Pantoea sp. B_9]KAA6107030.1 hypothetical protein F3I18_23030 [Pantoea sp. B_10]TQC69947.1 hypothetical protein FK492_19660 [Pantoea dispersa]
MKVKEKMADGRGRPRKYARGEMQYRKLWLPENLLMELRVAARVRRYTTNDEIISRLITSMQFSPRRHVIKTDEGQRLVALARMFDEFIQSRLDIIREKCRNDEDKNTDKKTFTPGKSKAFSSSFPENLRRDMEISARFNRRSVNMEIQVRLLDSLNYLTEQQLPENEEVRRLRELAILFDEFILEKVVVAENPIAGKEAGS